LETLIDTEARFNFSSSWNFAISPLEENKDGGWAGERGGGGGGRRGGGEGVGG
jgi:hypothetical protein